MNEQEIRRIIGEEIRAYLGNEKFVFPRHLQFLDGRNVQLGKTTGTQIGNATDEKLAFHGSTPVIQRANANQAEVTMSSITGADTVSRDNVNSNLNALTTLVNEIRSALIAKGLIKGSV